MYTAVDGIRVTVGQAELLMRKKMKQYLGLVTGAEDMTDGGNTTAEDLQVCALLQRSSFGGGVWEAALND